jgi:hypothetical protein
VVCPELWIYGSDVKVRASADPRDVRWETDVHRYRVHFWSQDGGVCSEYELFDAPDVASVLSWAEEHAQGRVPEVFAYLTCSGEPGVARLLGGRPNGG